MQEAYVFFGGKRIANRVVSSGAISYYAEDFIGSSRVITTSAGATCYDADFYPYGSESNVTNTCPQNYKWTGKERDAETGNDDFDARYYSPVYGRFLSADWSAVPEAVPYANLTNPQTLNLYAIVRDNPETYVDLDGHLWTPGGAGQCGDPTSGCGGSDQNAAENKAQKAEQNQNQTQSAAQQLADARSHFSEGAHDPKAAALLRLLDLADKGAKAIDTALPEIGASGNISIWGFDEKGHNSVVSDPVSAGGSIVARWGSPSENENLGEVTAGMKHLGIGTNVTDSGMQGVNVHVGVSVGSPVTVSARWDVFKTGAKEMASSVLKFFGSGANYPVY